MDDSDADDDEVLFKGPFARPRDEQLDFLQEPLTRHELTMLLGPLQTAVTHLHASDVRDHAGDEAGRIKHLTAAREALGETFGKFRALLNAGIDPHSGEEL